MPYRVVIVRASAPKEPPLFDGLTDIPLPQVRDQIWTVRGVRDVARIERHYGPDQHVRIVV